MSKHDDLLPQVKPSDWAAARKKLEAGDGGPMVALLRQLDLPIGLTKLFAEVCIAAKACRAIIDQGPPPEALPTLRHEQVILRRLQPQTVDDVRELSAQIREYDSQEGVLTQTADLARHARDQLGTLHDHFPELLGPRPPECQTRVFDLPATFDEYLREAWPDLAEDISKWRELHRKAEPAPPRKRIVSAIGSPPKPPQ